MHTKPQVIVLVAKIKRGQQLDGNALAQALFQKVGEVIEVTT